MEVYKAKRSDYLYKQGDCVDGVYLLISGKVELIKESWEYEQVKMQKYASERFGGNGKATSLDKESFNQKDDDEDHETTS